ncbi:hypothetical protein [Halostella salina]|uniref:hypothetical protein n=1 Tax=Halostella salina TaxID=1547897 RepID=UPI0013CED027|nr:hypothetical protein [Halostella salina]
MSDSQPTSVGPNSVTEQLLSLYGLGATSWTDDIAQSDTDRLLAALLLELREESLLEVQAQSGDDYHENDVGESAQTAEYYADTVTLDGDGERVDLGFIAESIDLRFDDDIAVAFKQSDQSNRTITYTSGVSPIASIPASTRYVWLSRADSAESDPTVQLEAWS